VSGLRRCQFASKVSTIRLTNSFLFIHCLKQTKIITPSVSYFTHVVMPLIHHFYIVTGDILSNNSTVKFFFVLGFMFKKVFYVFHCICHIFGWQGHFCKMIPPPRCHITLFETKPNMCRLRAIYIAANLSSLDISLSCILKSVRYFI